MTVNELIQELQQLADPSDGNYGNAEVFVLVGPNDVRPILPFPHGIDEWFSRGAVWIKVDALTVAVASRYRELMDELKSEPLLGALPMPPPPAAAPE